jgi:C-terminal peptidase prc
MTQIDMSETCFRKKSETATRFRRGLSLKRRLDYHKDVNAGTLLVKEHAVMSRMTAIVALLVLSGSALAADLKSLEQASPQVRADAARFAQLMSRVLAAIESQYVRPVERSALVEAAIAGLFEAVREPLPAGIRNDLARARSNREFEYLLAAARAHLGDSDILRDHRALLISMKALPRTLDPYCGVPTATEQRRNQMSEPDYGLGLEFDLPVELPFINDPLAADNAAPNQNAPPGPYRILTVHAGSPAQRAGLRPGDMITHVGGQSTSGNLGPALLRRITFYSREGRGGSLEVTVRRADRTEPLNATLTAGAFAPEWIFGVRRTADNHWSFMLDSQARIGYVRIGFIDQGAPGQLENALRDLASNGMKGLIVDLRDCPGGYVDPAVEVVSMFVPSGTIATVSDRTQGQQRHQTSGRHIQLGKIPIIALVNGATMGGGEMIASALQDHNVAKICGQRTFGKGSVQRSPPIPELGYAFKLTTGLFTRPNGKNLHRFPDSKTDDDWGVRPSEGFELPVPPDLQRQLKDWYTQIILRPGNSREPLPLDDPDNDPVRQFATREIKKLLK